ncbi:MAG: universal stress protein [Nitrospirota bacterium]
MGRLGKKFEDMMSAAAFAEAGEFETAQELARGRKKVLLVLTGSERDARSMKYALNTAKRTDAALEVLAASKGAQARRLLDDCVREAEGEGVDVTVAHKDGCIKEAIIDHTRKRRDFLCVVVESTGALNLECSQEAKKLEGVWKKLGCPLVLVSET